jgi:hypothetical protein
MDMNVADFLVERLQQWQVRRIFGSGRRHQWHPGGDAEAQRHRIDWRFQVNPARTPHIAAHSRT